jgi:glycosyltransferase involved in cell wall biosynthesis
MKILHYINNLGSGGAEKLLTDILPLMKKEGHEVSLVISNSNRNMKRHEEVLKSNGIKVIDLNTSFYNPFQIISIVKLIFIHKYDVIHSHLFPSQYWLALASVFISKNVKLIKTEHSSFNKRRKYKILRPLEKIIYNRYHLIIAISENVKFNLNRWLRNRVKIVVVENGIDLEEVHRNIRTKSNLYSLNYRTILMVSRFDGHVKDHSTLVKAINKLPDDIHLYLAGDGPNKKNIMDLVQSLNLGKRVFFLGLRNDVINLMHHADLNVLSTNHEGFSGVTLESLASGAPFLGSNVAGVKEIVPNNSFLFSPGNVDELTSKISRIIENDKAREQMIKASQNHIKRYHIEKMIFAYLDSYKNELKE